MLEFAQVSIWTNAAERAFVELSRLVLFPVSRTYWVFLVVSLAIAVILSYRDRRQGVRLPARLDVFSSETWLGRSALNDYWLVLLNAIVFGAGIALLTLDADDFAQRIASFLRSSFPGFAATPTPWAAVALAAALFLVDDALRYGSHWLEHRVPFLWEFHKVHHSAEALNFITAERHHPVSMIFSRLCMAIGAATVNGLFIWAYQGALTPASLLGANLFWILSNLLASSLRHSPVWLSFGPKLERWLISPAQHQIHHSADPRHFGTNLGGTLAIWDRMFGTLFVTGGQRIPLTFGLGKENESYRSVPSLYFRPILASIRMTLKPLVRLASRVHSSRRPLTDT